MANLFELMQASPTLKNGKVVVTYGKPKQWEERHVFLTGNVPDIAQEAQAQCHQSRDEAMQVEVIISSMVRGHSMRESVESAFAMLAVIEIEILRPNWTIATSSHAAGPALFSHIEPNEVRCFEHAESNEAQITCVVNVAARI
jgi:hypothetical protein